MLLSQYSATLRISRKLEFVCKLGPQITIRLIPPSDELVLVNFSITCFDIRIYYKGEQKIRSPFFSTIASSKAAILVSYYLPFLSIVSNTFFASLRFLNGMPNMAQQSMNSVKSIKPLPPKSILTNTSQTVLACDSVASIYL